MLTTGKIWLNHFEYHAEHPRRLSEDIPNVLTETERRLIAPSISVFQLGEQSPGTHLLQAACAHAEKHNCPEVARITELLIREEQQHAALLRAFMSCHGIVLRREHWTDRVFRRIRRRGNLEWTLSVLLTAELIGNVYYRSLEVATGCQRLRLLCRMLVADELAHVGFESDLLMSMRVGRTAAIRMAIDTAHRAFFLAAASVVWMTHRPVLKQAGYGVIGFLRACFNQYRFYLETPERLDLVGSGP